jgi:hypothetical protein
MRVVIIAATSVQPLPEPVPEAAERVGVGERRATKRCFHHAMTSGPDEGSVE